MQFLTPLEPTCFLRHAKLASATTFVWAGAPCSHKPDALVGKARQVKLPLFLRCWPVLRWLECLGGSGASIPHQASVRGAQAPAPVGGGRARAGRAWPALSGLAATMTLTSAACNHGSHQRSEVGHLLKAAAAGGTPDLPGQAAAGSGGGAAGMGPVGGPVTMQPGGTPPKLPTATAADVNSQSRSGAAPGMCGAGRSQPWEERPAGQYPCRGRRRGAAWRGCVATRRVQQQQSPPQTSPLLTWSAPGTQAARPAASRRAPGAARWSGGAAAPSRRWGQAPPRGAASCLADLLMRCASSPKPRSEGESLSVRATGVRK